MTNPIPELPFKDFKVTLYAKPRTYKISAQTHMGAIARAVQEWHGDTHFTDEFYREDVTDLQEVESWPTQEN